jgi:hypothetical protein
MAAEGLTTLAGRALPDASPKIQEAAAQVVHAGSPPYRIAVDVIARIAYILCSNDRVAWSAPPVDQRS